MNSTATNQFQSKFYLLLVIFIFAIGGFLYINETDLLETYFLKPNYYYLFKALNYLNKSSKSNCSIFNRNYVHYSVVLNNQTYPKYLNLYKNKSVNFECLSQDNDMKVILFWNAFFGQSDYYYGLGKIEPFVRNKCPITNCELTNDKSRLNESHYVITHMRDNLGNLPKKRPQFQKWIFMVYESPAHTFDFQSDPFLVNFYNLTSTYRIDSDYPNFYEGGLRKIIDFLKFLLFISFFSKILK